MASTPPPHTVPGADAGRYIAVPGVTVEVSWFAPCLSMRGAFLSIIRHASISHNFFFLQKKITNDSQGCLAGLAGWLQRLQSWSCWGDGFNFLHIDLCFECALNSED
jgi:hypothetical protein